MPLISCVMSRVELSVDQLLQAFGALTHALTTTIKNNTTGRPLSNVEVVGSVSAHVCHMPLGAATLVPLADHLTICW